MRRRRKRKKEEKWAVSVRLECDRSEEVKELLVSEIRSLDILSVKKLAKLSAREVPGEECGNGDEDLSSKMNLVLTVCHRRFVLSETERQTQTYCFCSESIDGGDKE